MECMLVLGLCSSETGKDFSSLHAALAFIGFGTMMAMNVKSLHQMC